MDDPPRVTWSVITVTYNSEEPLARNWSPILDYPWVERIIVDNGSFDASCTVAKDRGAQVLALRENRGFSAANNLGVKKSRGKYLLFANPDVNVCYDDLSLLANILDDGGGLLAPQLVNPDGTIQPNGRGLPYLSWKVRNRLPGAWANGPLYRRFADAGELVDVEWLIGATICVTRDDFWKLGGWDEGFFLYYEDSDIGLRARQAGMPVRLTGSVRWTHEWARETTRLAIEPWRREFASMRRFYSKYPRLLAPRR